MEAKTIVFTVKSTKTFLIYKPNYMMNITNATAKNVCIVSIVNGLKTVLIALGI